MINRNKAINFIAFQLAWPTAVLGAAKNILWPCYLLTIVFAIWQLHPKNRASTDLKLLALAIPIGLVTDSAWQYFNFIEYTNTPFSPLAPLWIICLWVIFPLTFNHSMSWLKGRKLAIILFGLVGSPLSYFAGSKFGAMEYLINPWIMSIIFGISWTLILLFLFSVTEKSTYQMNG